MFQTPGYRKEPGTGLVRIRGSVKNGTTGSANPIFTLPTGYRPPADMLFPVENQAAISFVGVTSAGSVYVYSTASNARVSLDTVVFAV